MPTDALSNWALINIHQNYKLPQPHGRLSIECITELAFNAQAREHGLGNCYMTSFPMLKCSLCYFLLSPDYHKLAQTIQTCHCSKKGDI